MSNHTHKPAENDVFAWIVIAVIFGAVNLALWAGLLWPVLIH